VCASLSFTLEHRGHRNIGARATKIKVQGKLKVEVMENQPEKETSVQLAVQMAVQSCSVV